MRRDLVSFSSPKLGKTVWMRLLLTVLLVAVRDLETGVLVLVGRVGAVVLLVVAGAIRCGLEVGLYAGEPISFLIRYSTRPCGEMYLQRYRPRQ